MRSLPVPSTVIPAQAGIQFCSEEYYSQLDSRLRGNDEVAGRPRTDTRTRRYVKTTNPFLPPEAHPRLFRRLRPALSIPQGQSMSHASVGRAVPAAAPQQAGGHGPPHHRMLHQRQAT